MNPRALIPGLLILLLGVGLLLTNLGVIHIDWNLVWRFWPVLLILAGIGMLFSSRRTAWLGVGMLILLAAGLVWLWKVDDGRFFRNLPLENAESDRSFSQEYSSDITARARFVLDAGAGDFNIEGTTDKLVEAETRSSVNTFNLERKEEDGLTTVRLNQSGDFQGFSFNKAQNSASVRLNSNPLWDFEFNTGAASLNADLSKFKVDSVTVDAGAASVVLKLGSQQTEARADISTGAASVKVLVPESVGCEIIAKTGLSGRDFDGFTKDGSRYRSPNFDTASKKIYITFETGLSSVSVERY